MQPRDPQFAYATLVTGADYEIGAVALARSLAAVGSAWPLVALHTEAAGELRTLAAEDCRLQHVAPPPLSAEFRDRHERAALHQRAPFEKGGKPSFHSPLDNFCKLEVWQLTDYRRVVFLDADTLVVKNIDKLFGYPQFSAAPNLYETLADMHRLNSGVFVAEPNEATYRSMLAQLDAPGAFWRRTDQTFLQEYFPDWHGLPYTFNALQYLYFNLPELWRWSSIKVVHYQYEKPWTPGHAKAHLLRPLIDLWHTVLRDGVIPDRVQDPANSGLR